MVKLRLVMLAATVVFGSVLAFAVVWELTHP